MDISKYGKKYELNPTSSDEMKIDENFGEEQENTSGNRTNLGSEHHENDNDTTRPVENTATAKNFCDYVRKLLRS